jgi:putative sigma-54 modulation protein
MTLKIIARDTKISQATEKTIEKKLSTHLRKYKQYQDDNITVIVRVTEQKPFTRVDVDMPYLHYHIHAEEQTTDGVLTGIDKCIDSLERQIEKYKTRMHRTKFKGRPVQSIPEESVNESYIDGDGEYKVIKVENFELKPMSIDEAILQMEVLDNRFLVFHNTETESISIIYKRDDGNIGLIEPTLI